MRTINLYIGKLIDFRALQSRDWNFIIALIVVLVLFGCKTIEKENYPDPATNPESSLMLQGDWFEHPHKIDFAKLPRIPSEKVVVSDVSPNGVNQHNYLIFYEGKYWIMWSDGPGVEDRVGQVVKYATSFDGLNWSEPDFLTPFPRNSDPNSTFYNTRNPKGFRWISRGFWEYNNQLLALVSLDEAGGFFGPSLELHAFKWSTKAKKWEYFGLVQKNAINNFPPKQLPSGEWLMSRRPFDYEEKGVDFMVGATENYSDWKSYAVLGTNTELAAEEPYWWILPDNKSLMALFRDNHKSGYLFRSFSIDNGRSWSKPTRTNFPDARSKFHGIRLKDGRYLLVSNTNPEKRDPLTLAISNDSMVFTELGYLEGGRHIDYPFIMEHDGILLVAFAGDAKRKIEILKIKVEDLKKLKMSSILEID